MWELIETSSIVWFINVGSEHVFFEVYRPQPCRQQRFDLHIARSRTADLDSASGEQKTHETINSTLLLQLKRVSFDRNTRKRARKYLF